MRINFRAIIFVSFILTTGCSFGQTKSLFNGKNLEGWHIDVPELDKNEGAPSPFVIRKGLLVSLGNPGGHLITDSIFSNYRIEVQYRFAGKPGNCGLLVHASKSRALYGMFPQSIEVQIEHTNAGDFWCIEENVTVPDMEVRRGDKSRWGINGDKLRKIERLVQNVEKPVGDWNKMVVECKNDQIIVWVNNILVNHGYNCTATSGHIALQAEGSEVEFRKVSITKL
jgi:hypothetical protein